MQDKISYRLQKYELTVQFRKVEVFLLSGDSKNSFILGSFIKELRKSKGYTLRDVEENTGISILIFLI